MNTVKKALGLSLAFVLLCTLMFFTQRSLAKPIRRPPLAETPPLRDVFDMMVQREDPVTHIRRLPAGALSEFDLNRDGRISDLERAWATALVREQRQAFNWYREVFHELSTLPAAVFQALLPRDTVDASAAPQQDAAAF